MDCLNKSAAPTTQCTTLPGILYSMSHPIVHVNHGYGNLVQMSRGKHFCPSIAASSAAAKRENNVNLATRNPKEAN